MIIMMTHIFCIGLIYFPTHSLTFLVKETLKIVGRIPPKTVWQYIQEVSDVASKEIILVSLLPASQGEAKSYTTFFNYLNNRDRFGVVGNNSKMVKDCYIIALPKNGQIHECLKPLDGPGLEDERKDILLALIVR